MSIFIMGGKTFLNLFVNDHPLCILSSEYFIISTQIKRNNSYGDKVVSYPALFPKSRIISDYLNDNDFYKYESNYINQLKESNILFATIISQLLKKNKNVIFLCSQKEWTKYKYLKIIGEYIEETFGYHVYDYKKFVKGTDGIVYRDKYKIRTLVNEVLYNEKRNIYISQLSTRQGRTSLCRNMTKDEKIKYLKSINAYYKNMSNIDIEDQMEYLFINRFVGNAYHFYKYN